MAGKEGTVFVVDGEDYLFDFEAFNESFRTFRRKILYYSVTEVEKLIAENANVSQSAVHSWRFRQNGPSDIGIVYSIAEVLRVPFQFLLKGVKRDGKTD